MRHPRSVSPEIQAIPHDRGWKRGKRAPTGHSHVAHSRLPAKGQDRPILWYDYDRKPRLPVHSGDEYDEYDEYDDYHDDYDDYDECYDCNRQCDHVYQPTRLNVPV